MSAGGWIAVVVVVLVLYGFARLSRRREISDEEFEREARRPAVLRTGLQELQGFLEPTRRAAQEAVLQEKKKTATSVSGDPPSPVPPETRGRGAW